MTNHQTLNHQTLMTPKLFDALYTEAMVLADEARSYFESGRFHDECDADSAVAVAFSCESLKVTTRLMHCIAWLLNQKAVHSGELSEEEIWHRDRMLGYAAASDSQMVETFPQEARQIINVSEELFMRLHRLSARLERGRDAEQPPVHDMLRRLENSL